MTIYEMNQASYGKLPTMNDEEIAAARKLLLDYLNQHRGNYYMLLNHETSYFTLFHQESPQFRHLTADNVLAILRELGEVKSIEYTNDQMAIECWVSYLGDPEDTHMYLLFDYSRGVVESK